MGFVFVGGAAERLMWTLWLLQMSHWLYQGSCEIKLCVQLGSRTLSALLPTLTLFLFPVVIAFIVFIFNFSLFVCVQTEGWTHTHPMLSSSCHMCEVTGQLVGNVLLL